MVAAFRKIRIELRENMLKRIALAALTTVLVMPAFAQTQENSRAGLYEQEDGYPLTANLKHLSGNRYSIALSTVVPMTNDRGGCAGSLEGEIDIDGNSATLAVPNEGFIAQEQESAMNKRFCEVNLHFYDQYKLELKEVSGCTYYHGAACEFSGVVLHEASGI
jgi:hypothetical protein